MKLNKYSNDGDYTVKEFVLHKLDEYGQSGQIESIEYYSKNTMTAFAKLLELLISKKLITEDELREIMKL